MARIKFNRIFNESSNSRLKISQAEERVESCRSVWVDSKTIRDLSREEQAIAISAKLAGESQGMNGASLPVEIPGCHFTLGYDYALIGAANLLFREARV